MSKTISDNYTTTKDFFIKDAYRFVPGLSDKDLGTASSSSEKWMTFRTAFDAVEKSVYLGTAFDIAGKWITFGMTSSNLEKWSSEHKRLLENLQKMLKELEPQLSAERMVEVKHDDEAILFCVDQSLIKYLGLAEGLIKKHFNTVHKITFSLEYDPETSEKWVIVDAEISGEIDQVIEWEDNFVRDWVTSVPYPQREKIRLSCDII